MKIESVEYGWGSAELTVACQRVASHVLKELTRYKINRVLDVGCGNGSLCGVMAAAGYDVVGVENDASGVAISRRTYPHIPFYHFGVQDDPALLLQQNPVRYDAVVCTEVVEHLYSPKMFFRYAKCVLRPGGVVIITVPYYGYLKNLIIALSNKWDQHHGSLVDGGHIKFFSTSTMRKLFHDSGYEILFCGGIGRRTPYLWNTMITVGRPTVSP